MQLQPLTRYTGPLRRGRARTFLTAAMMGLGACSGDPVAPERRPVSVVIPNENRHAGTTDWFNINFADTSSLSVWAAPYSVHTGDSLVVFVRARQRPVRLTVYRFGWYEGAGAREMLDEPRVAAGAQPACSAPFPGPVTCPWHRTMSIAIPPTWVSGAYLLKITDTTNLSAFYPFVVVDGRRASFVAVIPQFTWQAYNTYGGSSLYTAGPDGHLGHYVSFERPYSLRGGGSYLYGEGYSNEFDAILWLERIGADVTYVSDADVPNLGSSLPSPLAGLIYLGHDEYWTMEQYQKTWALRDQKTHLMFLSGNDAFERVRVSPGTVTGEPAGIITCFKMDPDPDAATLADRTTQFRILGLPENQLIGVMYVNHTNTTPLPLIVTKGPVRAPVDSFLRAGDLNFGDTITAFIPYKSGLTGWPNPSSVEGDQVVDNGKTPPGLQVLSAIPYLQGNPPAPANFQSSFYIAASGAGVFASGSNEWGRYLGGFFHPSDPRIDGLTTEVLNWMSIH